MRKTNWLYYLVVFVLMLNVSFNLITAASTAPASEDIFNSSLHSVVEIKATTEEVGESFGTAIFIDKDGTLVTNAHVVTYKDLGEVYEFENISIRFAFEENYRSVSLVKFDTKLDIAVLKLNDINCNFKPIKFGDSSKIKTGNKVYAVGNLSNVGISLTEGIISNPSINVEYDGIKRNVIQCDLTIADGNSGGALFDKNGKLIGITTFRLKNPTTGDIIYGISYCVPTNVVLEYIK